MTTLFSLLMQVCGLSHREAGVLDQDGLVDARRDLADITAFA